MGDRVNEYDLHDDEERDRDALLFLTSIPRGTSPSVTSPAHASVPKSDGDDHHDKEKPPSQLASPESPAGGEDTAEGRHQF